jgi:hypothetical protein
MTPEETKIFFEKVLAMRNHQRAYFKFKASSDLAKAKQYEREVDQMLKKELQEQQSGQQKLFT